MSKVVLITGVAGGIGSATAQAFTKANWHVIGVDLHQVDSLPGVHHFIRADVSDIAASRRIFAEVADDEGRIDALINNAAIQICKPLVETTPDEWDAIMASNLRAVYLAVRHAYPLMRGHGGAIVNVSSVHAIATSTNIAAYAASKGGLIQFTRWCSTVLAPDIRVNAITPGGVARNQDDRFVERYEAKPPLQRMATEEDFKGAVCYLASDLSAYVTGQNIIIDGGFGVW